MAEREYGARLTADPQQFVDGANQAREAQKKLNDELGKSGAATKSAAEQSREFANTMKQQEAATAGAAAKNAALEQATGRLPPALRAAATAGGALAAVLVAAGVALANSVRAHEQYERALGRTEAALVAQGRAGEISRQGLAQMGAQLAALPGMTRSSADQTIAAMVQMRAIGGAAIAELSALAADYAAVTGQQVPQAAAALAKAFADPAKGARELDQQLGLLSVSQQIEIQNLVALGRNAQAQGVLLDALKNRIAGLNEQAMTPLERSTDRLSRAWETLTARMRDSSAVELTASALGKMVNAAAWLVEHERELRGLSLGPWGIPATLASGAIDAGRRALAPAPGMLSTYDARGFTGDARDLQFASAQALAKTGYGLAQRYDTEGVKRRELEGARAQMQEALGVQGQSSEYYESLGRALAKVNDELAKLGQQKDKVSEFQRLSAHVDALNASLAQSVGATEGLTQAERVWNELVAAVGAGTVKLTDEEIAELNAKLDQAKASELLIRNRERELKLSLDAARSYEALTSQQAALTRATHDSEVAFQARIDAMEFEASLIGATDSEREKAIARKQVDLEIEKQMAEVEGDPERVEALYRLAEARKAAIGVAIDDKYAASRAQEVADTQARETQAAFDRTTDHIEHALADAIMRGGQSGKELLEAAMRTAILTPIISPIVRPVAQAMSGLVNGAYSGIGNAIFGGGSGGGGVSTLASLGSFGGSAAFLGGYASTATASAATSAALIESGTIGMAGAGMEAGALGGMAGAMGAVGAALPWVGAGLLAASALGAFDGDGDAMRKARFYAPLGGKGNEHIQGAQDVYNTEWFGGMTGLDEFEQLQAAREQNLIRNLNLSPDQVGSINARLSGITRKYEFGMEHTDWRQSGAAEQIVADRLQAISSVLGKSIEELTRVMSMSAEQWQAAIANLEQAQSQAQSQLGQMVRALPGTLGITTLENYRTSLATSEVNAPLDRLSAARSAFQATLEKARTGDLDAINAFPGAAQSLLGIGRDVYASGSGFQELFVSVNQALNQVLDQQRATQADILKDVPATIMQASIDQVAELKRGFANVVQSLENVQKELKLMRASA